MKIQFLRESRLGRILPFVMIIVFILACSGGAAPTAEEPPAEPPAAVQPTNTTQPTEQPTNTPRPTSTPMPTETAIPTPAGMGEPVVGEGIEITVVDAFDRDRIYPGGEYLYTPNPGYLIIDMGVYIRNLNPGQTVSLPWNQVFILEDNGDAWFPIWGKEKVVGSGDTYDPFNIGISSVQLDGDTEISFDGDLYMRIVYIVRDSNEQILFGIGESPLIEVKPHQ